MMEYVLPLMRRYQQKGILIDTNLLLLYFVGSFKRDMVPRLGRTKSFAVEDYDTLVGVMDFFALRVTTPNILTEVSNLLPDKAEYFVAFAQCLTIMEEHYLPSHDVMAISGTHKFGLTDAGIAKLAGDRYLVLTEDLPLYGYLANAGIAALNFNHIRTHFWS